MKFIKSLSLAVTLLFAMAAGTSALAHEYSVGNITVEHPWSRATAAVAKSGGAFMMLKNSGTTTDRLISVASPIAKMTHLHQTIMENDVMKMRPVKAIEVPAGGMAELKPGSFHVMFMGLKQQLVEGEMFPLTLTFENAGSVEIMVYISEAGAMGEMDMDMDMNSGN